MERKIEKHRSPFEVFDRAAPDPSASAELGAELRQHLAGDGAPPPPWPWSAGDASAA
jgi:hypothetical protein